MRLKSWIQDWLACYALRFIATHLSWQVFFRLASLSSRIEAFFRDDADSALSMASRFVEIKNARLWKANYRLARIVDQVDAYIARKVDAGWIERNVCVTGTWPEQACVVITFHFGTGVWALQNLRINGRTSAFLTGVITKEAHAARPCGYQAELDHLRVVEEISGSPTVSVGGSIGKMRTLLGNGVAVVGLIDVPGVQPKHRSSVDFFGQQTGFPTGLLYLAETERRPLVVFTCHLDCATGKRMLDIHNLGHVGEGSLQAVVDVLQSAISRESSAWHFWPHLPSLLDCPGQALAKPEEVTP